MKRLHVNVAVSDLGHSVRFYTTLFAAQPSVLKPDYAKWLLEDPRVNFSITTRGARKGIDHLGVQVEDEQELAEVYGRLEAANAPLVDQGETTCCYAQSSKRWIFDPEGIAWEAFLTRGESAVYGASDATLTKDAAACCDRPAATTAVSESTCCDVSTKTPSSAARACCG